MEEQLRTGERRAVPILLYHAVTDGPGDAIAPFAVPPAEFERQLDHIVEAGYRCITFSQLVDEFARSDGNHGAAPENTVVITFDDGYADFAEHALPALRERKLSSTLYVTTGWLQGNGPREPGPSDRMLEWSQLPELAAEDVEIGAHSHSHPQLDTLRSAVLRDEMVRPKELLEDLLGERVRSVAYPHGYNGPRVRRAAHEAGYDSGAAVRNRLSPTGEDVFRYSRLTVGGTTTVDELASWLRPQEPRRPAHRESLRTTAGRAYRRGRALVRGRPGSVYA